MPDAPTDNGLRGRPVESCSDPSIFAPWAGPRTIELHNPAHRFKIPTVGELRAMREILELTQKEVAYEVGVREHQVLRWDNGYHRPTLENLRGYLNCLYYEYQRQQAVTQTEAAWKPSW